jgi:hypothetical protein
VDEPELVAGLVQRAGLETNMCLQPGGDMRRARLLLRFAASLVATNVVHAASMLATLRTVVDAALGVADASEWPGACGGQHLLPPVRCSPCLAPPPLLLLLLSEPGAAGAAVCFFLRAPAAPCHASLLPAVANLACQASGPPQPASGTSSPLPPHLPPRCATAGPAGDDGRSWQPYTDQLVYMALVALPWGGPELGEPLPGEVEALLAAADDYVRKRPRSSQPSLRPFAAAIKEHDPVAE